MVNKSVKQQQAPRRARDRKPGRHGTSMATDKNALTHQRHTEAVTDLGMSESARRRHPATAGPTWRVNLRADASAVGPLAKCDLPRSLMRPN